MFWKLAGLICKSLLVKQMDSYSNGRTHFRSALRWLRSTKSWPLNALEASGYHLGDVTRFLPYPTLTPQFHFTVIWRSWVQTPIQPEIFSHEKLSEKLIIKFCFFKSAGFFQFDAIPNFFPTFALSKWNYRLPSLYPTGFWMHSLTSFQCYLSTIPSWFLSYLPSFTDLLKP